MGWIDSLALPGLAPGGQWQSGTEAQQNEERLRAAQQAHAAGGTQVAPTPGDAAKWAAYRDALSRWQAAEAQSPGSGGPRPTAPTAQDTPSAYPTYDPKIIEPNSAGGAGIGGANNAGGGAAPSAFDGGAVPAQPSPVGSRPGADGATPAAGPAPNLGSPTGERAGYSVDDSQGQQIRGRQTGYLDALTARMNGQAPSVAQAGYDVNQGAIARQNLGIAGQARGVDAVAARRQAILGNADQSGRAALGAALLRAQETSDASGQLGNALYGVRGQDTGLATHIGDQTLDATKGNLDRESTERIQGGAQGVTRESIAAQERASKYAADRGYAAKQDNTAPWQLDAITQGFSTGAKAAFGSDRRMKTDIKTDPPAKVYDFLDHLVEHQYRYRNPAEGPGERHGPMAQELEQSDIGRSLVHTGPDGMKRVDTDGLTMALAAAVARMNRDMKARKGA